MVAPSSSSMRNTCFCSSGPIRTLNGSTVASRSTAKASLRPELAQDGHLRQAVLVFLRSETCARARQSVWPRASAKVPRPWLRSIRIWAPLARNNRGASRLAIGATATLRTDQRFAIADGLFWQAVDAGLAEELEKNRQSIAIVAETEQIADRRNSCLKSRAHISEGSGSRSLVVRR